MTKENSSENAFLINTEVMLGVGYMTRGFSASFSLSSSYLTHVAPSQEYFQYLTSPS